MYPLILIMEYLNAGQILEQYKKGRRDFSNVNAHGVEIISKNLSGIIFRKANLATGTLRECNLTGADFTGANMRWMNLDNSNLTDVTLNKADLSYSKLINAIFKNTRVADADISYTLMFGVNRGGANFGDAIMNKVAWTESDVNEMSKMEVQDEAKKTSMHLDVFMNIQKTVQSLGRTLHDFGERVGKFIGYGKSSQKTYDAAETGYSGGNKEYGIESAYGTGETAYSKGTEYGMKYEYEKKRKKY